MGILDYQKSYQEQEAMKKASQPVNIVMPQPLQQQQPVVVTPSQPNVSPAKPAPQKKTETNFNNVRHNGGNTAQQSYTPYINNNGTYNYNAPANAIQTPNRNAFQGVSTGASQQLEAQADMQRRAQNRQENTLLQNGMRQMQGGPNARTIGDMINQQAEEERKNNYWSAINKTSQKNIESEGKNVADNAVKNWRDAIVASDDEKEEKRRKYNTAIKAFGDSLANIHSLVGTINKGNPLNIGDHYAQAKAEEAQESTAKLARQQQEAKQRQQDYENALKSKADARADIKLGFDKDANDRANKKSEDDAKKAALQLDELKAKIAGAKSDAAKKKYQAEKERVVASLQGKLMKSQIDAHEASASASRASAANSAASRKKTLKEISEMDKKNNITIYGDGENYTVSKNNYQSLGNNLRAIAKKNHWFKDATEENRATDKELLTAAYEHLNDSEVKAILRQATGKESHKL